MKDNQTGAVSSLGFTTNTSFKTTKQSKNVTYIVKTCYSNLRITASSGASIEVKGEPEITTSLITYKMSGNEQDKATIGTPYIDPGFTAIYSDGIDVTKNAKVLVSCAQLNIDNKAQKESYTFTKAGTYTLKYTITYAGTTEVATRTITVSEAPTPKPDDDSKLETQ